MPDKIKHEQRNPPMGGNDPYMPSTVISNTVKHPDEKTKKKFVDRFYNRETREYCGRTCNSWIKIIAYGIIYLLFLSTFTITLLYISLFIVKQNTTFKSLQPLSLVYPVAGIGLTAVPTSETYAPLIWYKKGEKSDYEKYVQAIDRLLLSNSVKKDVDGLGPCGKSPYGYGENPCVIIKINRHFHWSGRPLLMNSTAIGQVPPDVIKWMMIENNKLWLKCSGLHSYDKEHIGTIKYYPYPPGLDADMFPLHNYGKSPLIAIQISDFTIGMSLAIECKLWYENGPSIVDFVLYVAPNDSIAYSGQTAFND